MKKKLILIPTGVVVLAAAAIGIAVASGAIKQPEIGTVSNSWGNVTREHTEVQTDIQVHNPNSFGARIANVGLDVGIALNDVELGEGSVDNLELPPGTSTVDLLTVIDNSKVPAWWASHVEDGEHTTARISPTVKTSLIGPTIGIGGPSITREFDTDLLASANSSEPEDFSFGVPPVLFTLTLKSRQFEWGDVSADTTEIHGQLVLRHDVPVAVALSRLDFSFTMNGVPVAEATTDEPIVLSPNTDTTIPFKATVENPKLIDWWPTHINANEHSEYEIGIDVVLGVSGGVLGGQSFPIPVFSFKEDFQTNILGQ